MKIIIINGSPRKNGATAKVLHRFEEILIQKNFDVDFVNISELNILHCNGCCTCYKTSICYIKDDAEILSEKIANSQGIIIGSPTYASNISGQLKQFIDRGHFVIEQLLHNKYAISVVTGENYGSSDASKILTKLLKYSGAKISGKIVLNLPFNSSIQNVEKIDKRISFLAEKFSKDIHNKTSYLFQWVVHKIIFNFGIKPFVMKKGNDYIGVIEKWNSINIK